MGWRFWRCWGTSFYLDPEICMADLIQTLESLGIKPSGGEAPRNVYTEHRVVEEMTSVPSEPELQPGLRWAKTEAASSPFEVPAEPEDTPPGTRVANLHSLTPRSTEAHRQQTLQHQMPAEEENTVEVGDRVLVAYNDEPGRQHTIRISATEHDPDMRIIGSDFPLAQALLGAAVDEELEIPAGGGKRIITVVRIEKETPLGPVTPASEPSISKATSNMEPGYDETSDGDAAETEGQELARGGRGVPPPPETISRPAPPDVPKRLQDALDLARSGTGGKAPRASDRGSEPSGRTTHPHSMLPYKAWDSLSLPDPRGMPLHRIADRLVEIIGTEGPVVLERVFHLYATAAGITRVKKRLRGLFLSAAEIALTSGRIEDEGSRRELGLDSVVRLAGSQLVVLRKRGPRDFEEIPPSEVAEIMRSILRMHPATDREALYRRILESYDLKRLTKNVRRSLDRIVSEERFDLA
jgi:hypothetical protein